VIIVLALVILSFAGAALYGPQALVGMTAAWFAGGIGVVALGGVSFMVGRMMAQQASPRTGTTIIVLAAFVKFPVLVATWWLIRRQGVIAEQSFAIGIVLVYSALVGWAATRNAANP
jgi:hypothetical protein